ncbi:DUF7521 family protein [Halapricum salinum]|uniref:YapH protein n=1 Tax=Halapricum salinum TaxID=1457250 RepID=A0A4D6H904_9EURY|nr:hypothetical protein [Halapricum salinum]QCC49981.1 hypothetical protein DV733_01520 [Halapricum salinum]
MSPHFDIGLPSAVVAFKTMTLLLGGLITYFSYRAYKRTGSPALRALAIGFGFVTIGALLAGVTDVFVDVPINLTLAIESGLTTLGFAVIVYSLYAQE